MAKITELYHPRNVALARKAKRYGMQNSLRIVYEARRVGLPISLAFAFTEQESGNGKNVFGHDPTASIPERWKGTQVTKEKYRYYKSRRGRYGMQGVGPLQLTWWEYQDRADRLGGCHVPKYNIRVGFELIAALIKQHGEADGIRRYNGAGPAAEAYSRSVRSKASKWHQRLA